MTKILIIPGFKGSDENHWQSRWETKYALNSDRLAMSDFTSIEKNIGPNRFMIKSRIQKISTL